MPSSRRRWASEAERRSGFPLKELKSPSAKYRRLDERQIELTRTRLRDRIAERFPGSGLSHVADELRRLGDETAVLVAEVRRPHGPIRIGAGIAIAAMLAVLVVVVSYLPLSDRVIGYTVAHIVDMHQLTKDPERLGSPEPDTASSPERPNEIKTLTTGLSGKIWQKITLLDRTPA